MNSIADKSGSMAAALTREILGGVYRTGMRLPSERKLSEYFKVSRITIRAVLEEFENAGIIFRKACSGAYVTDQAIEILENRGKKAHYRIVFILPPRQQVNPLIHTLFTAFRQYIVPEAETSVIFSDDESVTTCELDGADAAVVFPFPQGDIDLLGRKVKKLIVLNQKEEHYDYITPDNYSGGRMMAEYLLECGHKNICCVSYPHEPEADFTRRLDGVKDVLAEKGLQADYIQIPAQDEFHPSAYAAALSKILKSGKSTAIACMTDKIAIHLYSQLTSFGVKLPDDISMIGFDDQFFAQFCNPPLTTIKYPADAMGKALADSLNRFLKQGDGNIREIIKPVLIKRQSVKNIK